MKVLACSRSSRFGNGTAGRLEGPAAVCPRARALARSPGAREPSSGRGQPRSSRRGRGPERAGGRGSPAVLSQGAPCPSPLPLLWPCPSPSPAPWASAGRNRAAWWPTPSAPPRRLPPLPATGRCGCPGAPGRNNGR
eukprot:5193341-Lingulodinium_polyedra.AAC.1